MKLLVEKKKHVPRSATNSNDNVAHDDYSIDIKINVVRSYYIKITKFKILYSAKVLFQLQKPKNKVTFFFKNTIKLFT